MEMTGAKGADFRTLELKFTSRAETALPVLPTPVILLDGNFYFFISPIGAMYYSQGQRPWKTLI